MDPQQTKKEATELSWAERNVKWIGTGLIVACVLTVVVQLLCGPVLPAMFDEKHKAHFEVENFPGFQAIFGFAAFVIIVYLGKLLRLFVMREENYYDS
ncbi:MAG: hypothetical protein AAF939_00455 [Planctomycetota bacterium]